MNNFNFLIEEFNFSKKTIAQISHMSQAIITMYAKGEKKIPPSKALIFSNFFACDEDFINSEQNGRLLLGEFDIKKTKIFDGKPIFAFNPKRLTISEYNQYKNNEDTPHRFKLQRIICGMNLSYRNALDLWQKAGYNLYKPEDRLFFTCLEYGIYDLYAINTLLYYFFNSTDKLVPIPVEKC